MKDNHPQVSAIVTNYNGWRLNLVPDFMSSFLKNDFKDFELFFVDNASEDGSADQVIQKFGNDKRVVVIKNPVNVMSAGINTALKQARGRYILFLNNDIYFEEGAVKKMVDFLDKNLEVALVQGKLVSFYNHRVMDDVGETMDLYGSPVTLGANQQDEGQYSKETEILSATGAASMLRAELLKEVGLLDPDYGIGYEDLDLALRLRIAGHKIVYLPTVKVFHRRSSSVSSSSDEVRNRIKYGFNRNRLATLLKNYQLGTLLRALPVTCLLYVGTGLFEMFYKGLWNFGFSRFKALGWMLVSLPILLKKRARVQRLRKVDDSEAIIPLLAKGHFFRNLKSFISSKKW